MHTEGLGSSVLIERRYCQQNNGTSLTLLTREDCSFTLPCTDLGITSGSEGRVYKLKYLLINHLILRFNYMYTTKLIFL